MTIRHWALSATLFFLLLSAGSAKEPLHILVTNSDGEWEPEQQSHYQPPTTIGEDAALSTDWKALMATGPLKLLSYSDRVKLLKHPRRLLSSTWATHLFSGRHVLLIGPSADGRVVGRLYDLQTGREESVVVSSKEGKSEARGEALREAANMAEVASTPVALHPDSGLYHQSGAAHLSPRITYRELPAYQQAEIQGYEPCRICFPLSDRTTLYDNIDRKLGELVAANIENRYRVATDWEQTQRVTEVGRRLLQENRFLDQGYEFVVLDSETINAYAAPTGPIYITTGLLEILESDDELAAILGHELSHSERKHAREQYERSQGAGVLGLLVTVATGMPWARLGSDILATVLVRGYSRGYELEADRDGIMAAYAAGYVPDDFLLVQEKLRQLAEQRGGGGPDWLRTHPRGEERLEQLVSLLEQTRPLRERLNLLEASDPGMARHLKSHLLELDKDEVEEYLSVYLQVLGRVRFELPDPEPPQVSPAEDDEFWEAVDMMLEQTPAIFLPEEDEPSPGP